MDEIQRGGPNEETTFNYQHAEWAILQKYPNQQQPRSVIFLSAMSAKDLETFIFDDETTNSVANQ